MDTGGDISKDDLNAIVVLLTDTYTELVEAIRPLAAVQQHYQDTATLSRKLSDVLDTLIVATQPRKRTRWDEVTTCVLVLCAFVLGLYVGGATLCQ